ncbi:SRR [Acanthosepion pharaonis]|uniref:Serine racemase n=1 Tax=Acanthosepion pharaonis TaxID=158019 RepID=A0A812CNY9_ACAPH|nr:SRR [Sepia pharaonis]
MEPTLRQILRVHERIAPYIHRTPVLTSTTADKLTGLSVYFKAENFQKTGAFKARGAINGILSLQKRKPNIKGVVTHSSGNHGQALAWAAQQLKLPCSVVVPENTAAVKINAIKTYGADVVLSPATPQDRRLICKRLSTEKDYEIIEPFDNYDVIAGQATIAVEFLEQVPDLEAIVVPVGGGGLSAGIALATNLSKPHIKVYMVEPKGKELAKSMKAGHWLWEGPDRNFATVADSINRQQLGKLTWPIVLKYAERDVLTVEDDEIIQGMKFAFQRLKIVVEAASATGLTALLTEKLQRINPSLQKVGVIVCGGNVDLDHLPWYEHRASK